MKNLPYIVIFILLTYIFAERSCRRGKECPDIVDTIRIEKVERIYDSTTVEIEIRKYHPVYIYDTIEIPMDVDTLAILTNYYIARVYTRTLADNEDMWISITDTVHQNKLFGGLLDYRIRKPLTIHETYLLPVESPKNEFYVGATIGGSKDHFSLTADLTYMTRKRFYIGASYDPLNKGYYLRTGTKLF